MTSDLYQPIPRPWYRRFRGNLRTNIKLAMTQHGRRVRRATSCAERMSSQFGDRSLTKGERRTRSTAAGIAGVGDSSEFINDLHVWFRSFRVKLSVRRAKARSSSGCESHPATIVPAGSNRSSRTGSEATEAFGVEGHVGDSASMQAVTRVNVEQASKDLMREPTHLTTGEGSCFWGSE
jgi:hypothetical protein